MSLLNTLLDLRPITFIKDVNGISLGGYDLVVSDYEPISAWAAKLKSIPCVALSHQASFLSPNTPRPKQQSRVAEAILQHFAPAEHAVGFHFRRYDSFIEPPIIRSSIQSLRTSTESHITVYLSAYYHDVLIKLLYPITEIDWHIFSPYCNNTVQQEHIRVYPVSNKPFLDSFSSCKGVICNAGFEMCAEAMYLGKKLATIPIQHQYEQQCNAMAMQKMGITILTDIEGHINKVRNWLDDQGVVTIDDIADPAEVVGKLLQIGSESRNMPSIPSAMVSTVK